MGNGKFPVQIVIGAVDEITYKVMAISDKLKKITEPIGKIGTAFKNLGIELGLPKIGAAVGVVGEKFKGLMTELRNVGLVAAGTGYAIYRLIRGTSDYGSAIVDASERIGISTDAFQAWNYEAVQVGMNAQDLEGSLLKFSKNMATAATEGGDMAQVFKALGISIRDRATGEIRSMEQVLPELARAMEGIKNPALRNKVLMELFGKSGAKMAAFLGKATEDVAEAVKRLKAEGSIIDQDTLGAADDFGDKLDALWVKFEAIKTTALVQIMPVLIDLLQQASVWLSQNKDAVIAWAKAFAADLPANIANIASAFKAVAAVLSPIIGFFKILSDRFGAFNVVALSLVGILTGKVIIAVYSLMGALVKLGIVAAANPIGLIAVGIGAVIAAIVLLIIYWDDVKKAFASFVQWVIDSNWSQFFIGPIAGIVKLIDFLIDRFNQLRSIGAGIASFIPDSIKTALGFEGAAAPKASGAALGAAKTAQAAVNRSSPASTENRLVVDFNNMPQGTRVRSEKAETPIDLNLGYGMVN